MTVGYDLDFIYKEVRRLSEDTDILDAIMSFVVEYEIEPEVMADIIKLIPKLESDLTDHAIDARIIKGLNILNILEEEADDD